VEPCTVGMIQNATISPQMRYCMPIPAFKIFLNTLFGLGRRRIVVGKPITLPLLVARCQQGGRLQCRVRDVGEDPLIRNYENRISGDGMLMVILVMVCCDFSQFLSIINNLHNKSRIHLNKASSFDVTTKIKNLARMT
jgi:hypothetical protein